MIPQISPARIEPRGSLILVKTYVKPEKVRSIFLPKTALEDTTGTLYEVVRSTEKADEVCGRRLRVGDILTIRWGRGVIDSGLEDPADRRRMYFLEAEHVKQQMANTWNP